MINLNERELATLDQVLEFAENNIELFEDVCDEDMLGELTLLKAKLDAY